MAGPAYALIRQELSQSPAGFAADVNAWLVAAGSIGIQSLFLTRREAFGRRPRMDLTISYSTPGPLAFRAAAFGGSAAVDPDALAAAFFVANPTYRVHFTRDIGDQRRGMLDSNLIMVVYATNVLSNCGQDRQRTVVVEALGLIAPGASGNAQLVSAAGLVAGGVITVTNRFDSPWASGTRGYAAVRPGSCEWDGYPSCC
jgi:hypothetical protein